MPILNIRAPDGSTFKLQTPENATREDIAANAKIAFRQIQNTRPTQQEPSEPSGLEFATTQGVGPRTPEIAVQRAGLESTLRENAPALGAAAATSFGGVGGIPALAAAGGRMLIPSLGRQVLNVALKPTNLAIGAGRAAGGGGVGEAIGQSAQDEQFNFERVKTKAIEQGIADPIARVGLSVLSFIGRPAGIEAREAAGRVLEFARREGLPVDPSAATSELFPNLISDFTKKFWGSRKFARDQMEAMGKLIATDPSAPTAFFKKIIGDVKPQQITKLMSSVNNSLARVSRTKSFLKNGVRRNPVNDPAESVIINAANTRATGESSRILFQNPAAARLAKSRLTKQEFDDLLTAHTQGMISRSSTKTGNNVILDGDSLVREIGSNREILTEFYGKEMVERLENFGTYAKWHRGVVAELDEAFITADSAVTTAIPGAGVFQGMASVLDPISSVALAEGTLLMGWMFSKQLFNPNSTLSRWLTTGAPETIGKIVSGASSVGIRSQLEPVVGTGLELADQLGGFGG